MKTEALEKLRTELQEERRQFRGELLSQIPYFHRLYHKYHQPISLELARSAGELVKKYEETLST